MGERATAATGARSEGGVEAHATAADSASDKTRCAMKIASASAYNLAIYKRRGSAKVLLDSFLMKHPIEDCVRYAENAIPALVQLFRRSQIHNTRLVLEHSCDRICTDLENLRSLRYGVELLLHS